ncbi:MAG TPA: glycosyltransferase [Chitinivibrionales bacterium]|nr:glycosyltransferase [Chitinivibrionales bacterium]
MSSNNSNLSILHFSTGKFLRGGERQVLFLHTGLLKRGYKSVLVCRKNGELALQRLENTVPVSWNGEWDLFALLRFIGIVKKNKPDVIHCHDSHALTHGVIAGKSTGVPVVYTRRVAFPMSKGFLSRKKYGSCAAIIAVSNAVAAQCKEIAGDKNVYVVGDGADVNAAMLPRAQARKLLGIPDDRFVIGTVAYFTAEKDVSLLFHLASDIGKRKPDAMLVCIGPFNEKLKRRHSFSATIVFKGKLDNAVQYYSAFDSYVSTSSAEGLGSALLDAVARDIPCAAVDAGGTRDLFPEGWPLVERGDSEGLAAAALALMGDYPAAKAAAQRCGARGRNIFSLDAMVEKTMAVYAESLHV